MNNLPKSEANPLPLGTTFFIIGIIFVALNLRPSITAVGPLIGTIRADLVISSSLAGLLTTLPLLAFAFLSPLAPGLGQRLGNERTIFIGLFVLLGGIILRSMGMVSLLFVGTALIGAGIAVCNVLLPGLIKQHFPSHMGILTGVYTTAMGTSAGIAAGISAPLALNYNLGWQWTLALWAAVAIGAILVWSPYSRRHGQEGKGPTPPVKSKSSSERSVWRSPLAWQVTLYMGSQSLMFYCLITWLPEILISKGMAVSSAGLMLAYMQFIGLPSTFLAPVLANRFASQKWLAASTGLIFLVGLIGLLFDPHAKLALLWVFLIGSSSAACISLALTMMGMRSNTAHQAGQLSGMSQSVGYLLAAVGPVLLGFLFDVTHSWILPMILLIMNAVLLTIVGYGAGRNRTI